MSRFPRLDILPAAQRALWPQLAEVSRDSFVLYGGTAVAVASVRSIPVVSLASSTLID